MKLKLFNWLIAAVLATSLTSCGSDDDPKTFDKSHLVGNYSGNCVVTCGTINFTDTEFPATFATNSQQASMLTATLGNATTLMKDGLSAGNINASGFEDHGDYANFSLGNISSEFTGNNVPDFIKNQVSFEIQKTTMNISCQKKAKYILNTKILTFEYKGTFTVTGKSSGQSYSNSISYTFSLTKK